MIRIEDFFFSIKPDIDILSRDSFKAGRYSERHPDAF